ncbi:MAG: hypothetical protein ACR2O0_04120 [Rhizobiaceae bacterium]
MLSRLLRAQLGTDEAMRSGAEAEAIFVLLDTGVETIELSELETGLQLNWRVGPADDPVSSQTYSEFTHTHNEVSKRPYSPVHLSAKLQQNGDIVISWFRRSRISADSWDTADIPLGETEEKYHIEIFDDSDSIIRSFDVSETQYTYPVSEQLQDHGEQITQIKFSAAQIASSGLAGATRAAEIHI